MFKKQGFTLPELMVVVLIMAVLMAVAVPMFLRAKARSEAKACRANLTLIDSAKKEWALDYPDLVGTAGRPNSTDLNPYIDGGFADLPACPMNSNTSPTAANSYTIGDMNTNPSCNTNAANVPPVAMSINPCSSGPDGVQDANNNMDDDHRLP